MSADLEKRKPLIVESGEKEPRTKKFKGFQSHALNKFTLIFLSPPLDTFIQSVGQLRKMR